MSRPVVGLSADIQRARFGVWEETVLLSPRSYTLAIQASGALAILLSPDDAVAEDPDRLLDLLDGLVIAGGSDVDAASYGAAPHPETRATRPERDRFEVALTGHAIERGLPLLGVCRGMQILNIACGGSLHQHLPEIVGDDRHRHTPGRFSDHDVRLAPGSLAARIAGGELLGVKSHHHQGLDRLGAGLEVTGWSAGDELVEAIELTGERPALGVLWHPEEDAPSGVIERFVRELVDSPSEVTQ